MKKSRQVPASLIVALAAGFVASGCNSRNAQGQCVDTQGRVLPDSACQSHSVYGAHYIPSRVGTGGFGGFGGSDGFFGG